MNYKDFEFYVGETIGYYQLIEHDLKLIYAGMLKGEDFSKNIELVNANFKGLGQVIKALEVLDNTDGKPNFSKESYKILMKLAKERNYFCHQCFQDFRYIPNFENSKEYAIACEKLVQANAQIRAMHAQTEKFRLAILHRYKRI